MPQETGKMMTLDEERALFRRLQQDASAVGEVYDLLANRLYGFFFKRCGHKETAEDLVSQTFVKFIEMRPRLEWREARLSALFFRIASNALTDYWRKASTRHEVASDEDEWDAPSADDPAWQAEISLESGKIMECMKTLSERDQEVLDLRFFAGLEAAEIARVLGIGANHAAVLVYRALARLRKRMISPKPEAESRG